MSTRKLFRFKYEKCGGPCYAWCSVLPEVLNKYNEWDRANIIQRMVDAHAKLCDNPDYSFGIDRDEATKMFVAHFRTPQSTETFLSSTFHDSIDTITGLVMHTDIPPASGNCTYGDNGAEDLGAEILRACTDENYLHEHHQNCPCQAAS